MIEIVDAANLETIGYRYDGDELAAARFSVELYGNSLRTGAITDDPAGIEDGLELVAELQDTLKEDSDIVARTDHALLRELFMPYLAKLQTGMRPHHYESMCERLGVKVFDLFSHGMTASACLQNDPQGLEMVDFRPDERT